MVCIVSLIQDLSEDINVDLSLPSLVVFYDATSTLPELSIIVRCKAQSNAASLPLAS